MVKTSKYEVGQRRVCPLCQAKGFTPDKGHPPALKTNSDGTEYCFRCGVEFKGGEYRRARVLSVKTAGVVNREGEMSKMGLKLLPYTPQTRFQREMHEYLNSRGVGPAHVVAWGLRYAIDGRYGGRAIFPCFGPSGVEFFVARSIYNHVEPKVLYPIKSGIWPGKSDVVWGLHALDSKPKEVVICEGVFDAAVTPNGIAILGRTLSTRQMRLIAFRSNSVAVMLDGDAIDIAHRMARRIRKEYPRMNVRVVELPKDKDPSDLGADGVHQHLNAGRVTWHKVEGMTTASSAIICGMSTTEDSPPETN